MTWWQLVGRAAAVLVWAVLGGVGFGLANDDVASIVVAVIATAVLALGFPRAQRAANRLLDRPSVVGMEGLVGRAATVDRWQVIATAPGALQLRQLQTMVEISAENNSTIVFPIPMELLEAITTKGLPTPSPTSSPDPPPPPSSSD
jgi:hypothetical protein